VNDQRLALALTALALALSAGCAPGQPPSTGGGTTSTTQAARPAATVPPATGAAAEISPAATAEADTIFSERCVTCHGATGHGDGPAAAALTPRPRNHSLADWQASVTDDQIAFIVVQGGPAAGKSVMMPPNPDLATRPDVVNALVAKIRGFRPGGA
jgi:mono/diheme cytochrome c family protein